MKEKYESGRIDEFLTAIMKVAQGDYSVQLELTGKNDYLDALAIGINMMVDDIKRSQVVEVENEKIKQLNDELQKAKAKAEESDRLKSAFLANMSHEIRTPMNGILGFTELLREPNLTEDERLQFITIIEKSGERMLGIINDIINISKIEAGQMEIALSETNVNEQIEYIYSFFRPEAEKKRIQLYFRNNLPSSEATINTDREKLYAILINLVKNAIKFTSGGSIEFGYNLISTSGQAELEFYVKDTGMGIPPDKLGLIFERFRQGIEDLSRNHEGSGLGLSISKAFIEMLGGKIWVESEEGKGSSFYFTIPYNGNYRAQKEIGEKNVSTRVETDQLLKLKILIAEDDEISEMLISKAVKKISREIINVRSGVEVVETCRNNPDIDLILMDIRMPDMDGYEATRQIRQFNKKVIIVAQTALGLINDREKAIEAGCTDYISKPINRARLIELVHTYFVN